MLQNQLMVADALFGSESDFGMRYYAEGQWYTSLENVPEGLSVESEMHVGMDYPGTVCTSYARYLWARFQDTGLNVRVMGFSVDANPNCRFSR